MADFGKFIRLSSYMRSKPKAKKRATKTELRPKRKAPESPVQPALPLNLAQPPPRYSTLYLDLAYFLLIFVIGAWLHVLPGLVSAIAWPSVALILGRKFGSQSISRLLKPIKECEDSPNGKDG